MSPQRHSSTSRKRATFVSVLLASALVMVAYWAAHSARQPAAQQLQIPPAASDSELPIESGTLEAWDLSPLEARCYLQRYPDLQELFGENVDDAKRHWKETGRSEQRVSKCPFLPTTHNSSFVRARTRSPLVLYVLDNQLYHVQSCHPCGPKRSVCDGTIPVTLIPDKDYRTLFEPMFHGKLFDCESMAPEYWEGNMFFQHRAPLKLRIDKARKPCINILMTGMGRDFTGGPLSIMHFANEMILQGLNVRWINIDGEGLKQDDFLSHATKYSRLEHFVQHVGFAYAAHSMLAEPIPVSPDDIFMATLYFTAQIAHFTAQAYPALKQKNFIYFIQDFEPIFFPHSAHHMEALEGYRFPHFAIYSTPFLQDWFLQAKYGQSAFLPSNTAKKIDSLSFAAEPAMKRWPSLDASKLAQKGRVRKLIVYARRHADRNAYELTVDGLSAAVCAGVFQGAWEFIGVGSQFDYSLYVGGHCGQPTLMNIRKNVPEPEYLELLRTGDIGYSLMISPHPSLPPLDFAAAGLVAVTNSFATKTEASFARVSSNFVVVEPYIDHIVEGLRMAVDLSLNITFRRLGSDGFKWENNWRQVDGDKCYGPPLFQKVSRWMKHKTPLW